MMMMMMSACVIERRSNERMMNEMERRQTHRQTDRQRRKEGFSLRLIERTERPRRGEEKKERTQNRERENERERMRKNKGSREGKEGIMNDTEWGKIKTKKGKGKKKKEKKKSTENRKEEQRGGNKKSRMAGGALAGEKLILTQYQSIRDRGFCRNIFREKTPALPWSDRDPPLQKKRRRGETPDPGRGESALPAGNSRWPNMHHHRWDQVQECKSHFVREA